MGVVQDMRLTDTAQVVGLLRCNHVARARHHQTRFYLRLLLNAVS